jgi:drug/metabolite transporter (DMT)-like permease
MTRRQTAALVLLALIWGSSFMFIKVAVRGYDPTALVWLRLALAAGVLVPVVLAVHRRAALREGRAAVTRLFVLGIVNSALPFLLISWAETRIDSGLTAILQAAAPLFMVVLAIPIAEERVTGMRLLGVAVGFLGVVLLAGAQTGGELVAALAVVAAAFFYATGGMFAARALRGTEPLVTAAGGTLAAALLLTPLGLARLPAEVPGWKETASVVVLGVVGTGLAYIVFFALLARIGPSRAVLVTYLIPAVALLYGAVLLGEELTLVALAGLALVLGGVALAGRSRPARAATVRTPGGEGTPGLAAEDRRISP